MRQFLCDSFPDSSGKLIVKGKNYRYLVKVLRFSEGEELDARLPDGNLVRFFVERVQQQQMSAVLRLVSPEPVQSCSEADFSGGKSLYGTTNSGKTTQGVQASEVQGFADRMPELWLFQFLPKPQKMDLIVRQATECGVRYIVPISGAFSVKNDSSGRKERWERIIREARQQSGSAVATEIKEVMSVRAAADMWKKRAESTGKTAASSSLDNSAQTGPDGAATDKTANAGNSCAFILDENPSCGKESLSRIDKTSVSAAAIAVGCEGGISDDERKVLLEAGFMPLHFTTNVLRAETASLYGIAVIQQFFSAD